MPSKKAPMPKNIYSHVRRSSVSAAITKSIGTNTRRSTPISRHASSVRWRRFRFASTRLMALKIGPEHRTASPEQRARQRSVAGHCSLGPTRAPRQIRS